MGVGEVCNFELRGEYPNNYGDANRHYYECQTQSICNDGATEYPGYYECCDTDNCNALTHIDWYISFILLFRLLIIKLYR